MTKNKALNSYLRNLLGTDLQHFFTANAEKKSLRINTLKPYLQEIVQNIEQKNILLNPLSFNTVGYSIENEDGVEGNRGLSHSIEFFCGDYTFQGASSQIPPIVLNPKPGEKVLDMAASPGSKTTQMGAMMQNRGLLVVNDSNLSRMQALNSNTQRTGMLNHAIYYLPGERLGRIYAEFFDKVLLDTPCTGLGTLATHREIIGWWSDEKLAKLNGIQHQLFVSAIKALKVGGEMVYSTCSVAPEENEMMVDALIQKYPLKVLEIEQKGLEKFDSGMTEYGNFKFDPSLKKTKRVWPHKHNMEGFYIARLVKTDSYYNKNNPTPVRYISTLTADVAEVAAILQEISEAWGIEATVWKNYRFLLRKKRIWMFAADVKQVVEEGFTNGGLLLADKRLFIWKLSHQAVQHFSERIKKRIMQLNKPDLKELLSQGKCAAQNEQIGYFALQYKKRLVAVVYQNDGYLSIKLPHAFKV